MSIFLRKYHSPEILRTASSRSWSRDLSTVKTRSVETIANWILSLRISQKRSAGFIASLPRVIDAEDDQTGIRSSGTSAPDWGSN